jgi:hypothetical protein
VGTVVLEALAFYSDEDIDFESRRLAKLDEKVLT